MKRSISTTIIVAICFFGASCGKHIYVLNKGELRDYAKKAKEPDLECFIVFLNGDTLKGSTLQKKKKYWLLDDQRITSGKYTSYQDHDGYRSGSYLRIMKGRTELYLHQVNDSRTVSAYVSPSRGFVTKTEDGIHTSFYLVNASGRELITLLSINERMKKCPDAVKQIEIEFEKTAWKKYPSLPINDYRALMRILEIFNKCDL